MRGLSIGKIWPRGRRQGFHISVKAMPWTACPQGDGTVCLEGLLEPNGDTGDREA